MDYSRGVKAHKMRKPSTLRNQGKRESGVIFVTRRNFSRDAKANSSLHRSVFPQKVFRSASVSVQFISRWTSSGPAGGVL